MRLGVQGEKREKGVQAGVQALIERSLRVRARGMAAPLPGGPPGCSSRAWLAQAE